MNMILLFDVAPDPVPTGMGVVGLILIAIVVLMITGTLIVGSVFLLRRLLRGNAKAEVAAPQVNAQFQPNNPNQP